MWRWWRLRRRRVESAKRPPEWPAWATERARVWPAVDSPDTPRVERECEG